MNILYVFLYLVGLIQGYGWVKVANFYDRSYVVELSSRKTADDLVVLLADTNGTYERLPLKDTPYYQTSDKWSAVNETLLFGRLSYFRQNYANAEVEHDVIRFDGNLTMGNDEYGIATVVNNEHGLNGSLCNVGRRTNSEHIVINVCLHMLRHSGIKPEHVTVRAEQQNCGNDCKYYKIDARLVRDSARFIIPQSTGQWRLLVNYGTAGNKQTLLCRLNSTLRADELYVVVMKENRTLDKSMYECVLLTAQAHGNDSLIIWIPVGIFFTLILVFVGVCVYRKFGTLSLRNLLPAPDMDTAPYRSFGDSTTSESPTYASYRSEPDLKYFKNPKAAFTNTVFTPLSEAHYERI